MVSPQQGAIIPSVPTTKSAHAATQTARVPCDLVGCTERVPSTDRFKNGMAQRSGTTRRDAKQLLPRFFSLAASTHTRPQQWADDAIGARERTRPTSLGRGSDTLDRQVEPGTYRHRCRQGAEILFLFSQHLCSIIASGAIVEPGCFAASLSFVGLLLAPSFLKSRTWASRPPPSTSALCFRTARVGLSRLCLGVDLL